MNNDKMYKSMLTEAGKKAKNQYTLLTGAGLFFISYGKTVVLISKNMTYLDKKYWNFSATTAKYRRLFLGEGVKLTREKIKSGKYELVNLNTQE